MPEAVVPWLAEWESFYVIVGSSAAALTGLTFVVIAVVGDSGPRRSSDLGIATFVTPTIVHFCGSLLISAVLSAPWTTLSPAAIALALGGVGGLTYSLVVLRRTWHVHNYKMVMEDWLWHVVFPVIAYCAMIAGAATLRRETELALFIVAGASLLLLLIGIHNTWDSVTHLTLQRLEREREKAGDQDD